jgi:hypothetical protein
MAVLINDIPLAWPIAVEDAQYSTSSASFEKGSNVSVIPYRVPRIDLALAPATFTGYSYREASQLTRVLPQPHPFWEGFYANRVSVRGESGWDDNDILKAFRRGFYDAYDEYVLEVAYTHADYDVRPDGVIYADGVTPKEHLRWVEKLPGKPTTETVQLPTGTLKFVTRNGAPAAPADQLKVQQPTTMRVSRTKIAWIWHEVPIPWILSAARLPTQLEARQGMVNAADWEGFAAETLLLQDIELEYTRAPVGPTLLGLNSYEPPRYVKATLAFVYARDGWNKLIYPGLDSWDRVEYVGSPGKSLYKTTNFDDLFKGVPP